MTPCGCEAQVPWYVAGPLFIIIGTAALMTLILLGMMIGDIVSDWRFQRKYGRNP